jgi:DNA-binding PadR family transcriptional regulator
MVPDRVQSPRTAEKLPRTETEFFILLSLSPGPLHGYAVMKRVRSLSDGRIALSTGTLYGALKRMLEQEWIERRSGGGSPRESGRIRKEYRLTAAGRRILEAEIHRLQELVRAVGRQQAGQKA